jgi:hypothetical protein
VNPDAPPPEKVVEFNGDPVLFTPRFQLIREVGFARMAAEDLI